MPTTLDASAIQKIEDEAKKAPISEIASYLQKHLGQKITAYLGGLKDIKEAGAWASKERNPRFEAEMRLRYAYQAAWMLVQAYGDATAKTWFFGTNTRLNDEAPAYILRNAKVPEDMR
ncbi:MAG: XRE family transcriptional regulator, partial [Elusimicrobiota bacterium]